MGILDHLFGPPSKENFAKLALRRFSEALPQCPFIYDRDRFQLLPQGDDGLVVSLANVYAEYCAAPANQRHAVLDGFVAALTSSASNSIPDSFEDAHDGIMPTLRARAFFELVKLRAEAGGPNPPPPVYDLLNEHLACGFVYDTGPAMAFLTEAHLHAWGAGIYQLQEAARLNLEKLEPVGFAQIGSGYYSVLGDADYGATRLMQFDSIRKMKVEGDYLAAVPNRGALLITGTRSQDGLAVMADLLQKELAQPRVISGFVFRWENDKWTPWLPEPSHPLHSRFKLFAAQTLVQDYGEQKQLLEQVLEKRGDDAFVADCTAKQHSETGEVVSICAWTKGVPTLLPKTDQIGFVVENQVIGEFASWERAAKLVGDLLVPQGMYPERYRVEAFPTDDQLAALTADGG